MKKRLISMLLACLLILSGSAAADGVNAADLSAGQIAVFTDCVITLNEIAWYGSVQSNLLAPASGGAPSVLVLRAQILSLSTAARDFGKDSSLLVRYGASYSQTGKVAEESFASSEGLYFVPSSSIQASYLQPVNIVAYAQLSSLMYYSAPQLEVQLTIGGHPMKISLNGAGQSSAAVPTAAPTSSGPMVVNPPSYSRPTTAPTQTISSTRTVPITFLDEDNRLLINPAYLEVPVGGTVLYTVPGLANSTFDHYSYLKNGQWYNGYGGSLTVTADAYGNLDKQEIRLFYASQSVTPPPTTPPSSSSAAGQIVRPYSWDTQFRPGTATAPDGQGDNANVYKQLNYLHDDNANTSISWILYVSERTDGLPEFTAAFNGASISAIGVRNGRVTSEKEYYQYARLASLHLRIHTSDGSALNTWVYLPDEYHPEYQILPLGKTYTNVTSIELWIEGNVNQGFYVGTGDTAYILHITDVQFYSSLSASPTQDPWSGASY